MRRCAYLYLLVIGLQIVSGRFLFDFFSFFSFRIFFGSIVSFDFDDTVLAEVANWRWTDLVDICSDPYAKFLVGQQVDRLAKRSTFWYTE